MRKLTLFLAVLTVAVPAVGQNLSGLFPDLTQQQNYVLKRVSSYDRTGANADSWKVKAGETVTVFEAAGPGVITHIWFTIASGEQFHLKKLVLRMYWDNETTPSVEAPIGDFYGLGLGDYFTYQSFPLAVGSAQALNCYFPMPFRKSGKITITDEGNRCVDASNSISITALIRLPSLRTQSISTPSIASALPARAGRTNGIPTATRWWTRKPTSMGRATTCGWKPPAAATTWA